MPGRYRMADAALAHAHKLAVMPARAGMTLEIEDAALVSAPPPRYRATVPRLNEWTARRGEARSA